MILDKATSELAVRVVYASLGPEAVEQAKLLSAQANSTMVVQPAELLSSPEATSELEVGALKTDGLVFVLPEQPASVPELRAAYEHARSQPLGKSYSAVIAPEGADVAALLGTGFDVPVVSGGRAAMDALQAVMKPMLLDLAEQFG